jgi:hypothetical protein
MSVAIIQQIQDEMKTIFITNLSNRDLAEKYVRQLNEEAKEAGYDTRYFIDSGYETEYLDLADLQKQIRERQAT